MGVMDLVSDGDPVSDKVALTVPDMDPDGE